MDEKELIKFIKKEHLEFNEIKRIIEEKIEEDNYFYAYLYSCR